jgi:hypothetical protein
MINSSRKTVPWAFNGRRPHSSLDGTRPIKPTYDAAPPRGSPIPADVPLIDADNLSRQSGPSHTCQEYGVAMSGINSKKLL